MFLFLTQMVSHYVLVCVSVCSEEKTKLPLALQKKEEFLVIYFGKRYS